MKNNTFNPMALNNAENEDFLINLFTQTADVNVNDNEREELKKILSSLPEGATVATLIKEIRTKEAEKFGVKPEHFESLMPLLKALQQVQENQNLSQTASKGDSNEN